MFVGCVFALFYFLFIFLWRYTNIQYVALSGSLSFIFDRIIIYKIIVHIDQSDNTCQRMLGF